MFTRITKISYRMFRNFTWPAGLADFGRFNLVYGWNASGKTTLSALFRKCQQREALVDGEADFSVDGRSCDLRTLSTDTALPQVRVFNAEFIASNVRASTLAPIFYLGAESVEKQQQVELLKSKLER